MGFFTFCGHFLRPNGHMPFTEALRLSPQGLRLLPSTHTLILAFARTLESPHPYYPR